MKPARVIFPGGHPLNILPFRADKHDFAGGWETAYLLELQKHLRPGMVVYDIGAENGEFGALAASIVKPHNVHLFEPSAVYWPNIKALWEANGFADPGGCYRGFLDRLSKTPLPDHFGWPELNVFGPLFEGTAHLCLHNADGMPTTNIDTYVQATARPPDVLLIDCEGAEARILQGAYRTLVSKRPLIFVSVHNDGAFACHSSTRQDLFATLASASYEWRLISIDHEEHWLATPKA